MSAGGARDTGEGGVFDPPYELGGPVAVLVGAVRGEVPLPASAARAGWRPLALGGDSLAVIVACHYDDLPPERPIPYHEVILALLVRRGVRLATLPISMQLDRREPTSDGRLHYSLPKVYEPTLTLSIGRDGAVRVEGDDLRIEAVPRGPWARKVLAAPCVLFKVGTSVLTAFLPVLGTAEHPHRRAIVALRPRQKSWPLKVNDVRVPRSRFRVLWAQSFERCRTSLGAPSTLDDP